MVNGVTDQAWQSFSTTAQLTSAQAALFKVYLEELIAWNEKINLTRIETVEGILAYHFQDSLQVGTVVDLHDGVTVCDVGTGAGFPGIPLKIKYPHLRMVLLEVNHKKIAFLEHIIKLLSLENVHIYDYDWRTFLRAAPVDSIGYFVARASLRPDELIRAFSPGCTYKGATAIYWAASDWQAEGKEGGYVARQVPYQVGSRQRKLVVLKGA